MLGVSGGLLGTSSSDGATAAAAAATAHEGGGAGEVGGGGGSNSGLFGEEEKGRIEEGDRNSAGNRWPRQETMALLQIRSDMDMAFRDSSLKGPLWEEVSRKLAELGYHRSAKKCKEKFENVYKYHKRTKDGRATKADGKTYRFFDQLQALEHHPSLPLLPPPPPSRSQPIPVSVSMPAMPAGTNNPPNVVAQVTVPSTTNAVVTVTTTATTMPPTMPTNPSNVILSSLPNAPAPPAANLVSNSMSSSSTSSDEEFVEGRGGGGKRKRKWKDFFERLMKDVIGKQEQLQKKFLDTIEKREHDRMVREEAWRMQEIARMNREHEILVQERSIAAAKDAAVIAFLQKISEQQNPLQGAVQVNSTSNNNNNNNSLVLPPQLIHPQLPSSQPQPPAPQPRPPPTTKELDIPKLDNGGGGGGGGENISIPTSSSRWPKAEVQALIQLRTSLDMKYQDSGPKGPLWEEISSGMRKIGYNRNAKRCKEKWENINKYFKKVKESNKQRPEDSKTCPYFHLLDALYKERNKNESITTTTTTSILNINSSSYGNLKPENINQMVPLMVQPEQQWPLQPPLPPQQRPDSAMEDMESENMDHQNNEEDDDDDDDDDEDGDGDGDGDEDEEEDEGGGYEIVSNKPSSIGTVE